MEERICLEGHAEGDGAGPADGKFLVSDDRVNAGRGLVVCGVCCICYNFQLSHDQSIHSIPTRDIIRNQHCMALTHTISTFDIYSRFLPNQIHHQAGGDFISNYYLGLDTNYLCGETHDEFTCQSTNRNVDPCGG